MYLRSIAVSLTSYTRAKIVLTNSCTQTHAPTLTHVPGTYTKLESVTSLGLVRVSEHEPHIYLQFSISQLYSKSIFTDFGPFPNVVLTRPLRFRSSRCLMAGIGSMAAGTERNWPSTSDRYGIESAAPGALLLLMRISAPVIMGK